MKLLVVGSGYVGLVTGACFAELGNHVTCLDIDKKKIASLKLGQIPIYEPGLEEMIKRNLSQGRLKFTTDYKRSVNECEICFIAVSTPSANDGTCDLSYVRQAAAQIAEEMGDYKIIVNKSTVPVGTAKEVSSIIREILERRGIDCDFDVISNPEFLKEGDAINDFMTPDRIVMGCDSKKAIAAMRELYAPFILKNTTFLEMDPSSAEMTKYAANAMLASRISFMNEMAGLCERLGGDIALVREGIGSDKRIGPSFLYPGVGYGGSCFPKDIKALLAMGKESEYQMPLLEAVEEVNENQKRLIGKKMESYFEGKGGLAKKKIAILGLAFKPGTDDMREAPSLTLIRFLLQEKAYLTLFDPVAIKKAKELLLPSPQIAFASSEMEALKQADCVALMTEWKQFRSLDLKAVLRAMKGKAFFDGRNQFNTEEMRSLGFDYFNIGTPTKPSFAFSTL